MLIFKQILLEVPFRMLLFDLWRLQLPPRASPQALYRRQCRLHWQFCPLCLWLRSCWNVKVVMWVLYRRKVASCIDITRKYPCAKRTQFWFPNILPLGQSIFDIHDYIMFYFFSHIQHSLLIWQICESLQLPICSYRSVSRLCFWERLNKSDFCTIAIPRDRISVFEIFSSPRGSIELPFLNFLPCQRKIVTVLTPM